MNELTFDLRGDLTSPVFAGGYQFGENIGPWEPEPGNMVALKAGEVTVLARIIEAQQRQYLGNIIGFEDHDIVFKGKKAGDVVSFGYEHLRSCSR